MACKEFDCGYPTGECSGACARSAPSCATGIGCHHQAGCPDTHCPGHPANSLGGHEGRSDAERIGWLTALFVVALLGTVLLASGAADGWLTGLAAK